MCTSYAHEEVFGWRLLPHGAAERTQTEFLPTIESDDVISPSDRIMYKSANTDVLGWVAEAGRGAAPARLACRDRRGGGVRSSAPHVHRQRRLSHRGRRRPRADSPGSVPPLSFVHRHIRRTGAQIARDRPDNAERISVTHRPETGAVCGSRSVDVGVSAQLCSGTQERHVSSLLSSHSSTTSSTSPPSTSIARISSACSALDIRKFRMSATMPGCSSSN